MLLFGHSYIMWLMSCIVNHESRVLTQASSQACDNCSKRKVKCDDAGPPCNACRDLGIPCTYEKPSKRRGPPNKHAEAIKRGRYDGPNMSTSLLASSPTHAAQTLASFSQQQVLSTDTICPQPILLMLVDDYFLYIHPLTQIPHEMSFRSALESGEAPRNTTFLALLASMVECVTAAYPRRPQQHYQALNIENNFQSSMSLVDRCNKVITEAQGTGYISQVLTIHDAQVNYLQGLTSTYTFHHQASIIYFKQCLNILQSVGAHKASTYKYKGAALDVPQARMIPNGDALQGPQPGQPDLVIEEQSKRTFWLLLFTARSLQQSGIASLWDLLIPPSTKSDPYPSLPLEIDDDYLTPAKPHPMPPDTIPTMRSFNIILRIYLAYNELSALEATIELLSSVTGIGSDANRSERTLAAEKALRAVKEIQESLPPEFAMNSGTNSQNTEYRRPNERKDLQIEIQKANAHLDLISTRLYLTDKLQGSRDDSFKDFMSLLRSINENSTAPLGSAFVEKVRKLASSFLAQQSNQSYLSEQTAHYLNALLDILMRLERVPAPFDGTEDNAEVQSLLWAQLQEIQSNFR